MAALWKLAALICCSAVLVGVCLAVYFLAYVHGMRQLALASVFLAMASFVSLLVGMHLYRRSADD